MEKNNVLEQRITAKEEYFSGVKAKLEQRLGDANAEYSSLLGDFRNQINYIKNDNTLSKEGKKIKSDEIRTRFINNVNAAARNHFEILQTDVDIALNEIQIKKLESLKGLNTEMLPQLIYVNSMLSSINGVGDVDLLESIFNYVSIEGNFSDEIVNMVYLKARNLINTNEESKSDENKVGDKFETVSSHVANRNMSDVINTQDSATNITKVKSIITKINKYKKDYTKELSEFKRCFTGGANNKKYPSNLYMCKDPRGDFRLPGEIDINNPWNR